MKGTLVRDLLYVDREPNREYFRGFVVREKEACCLLCFIENLFGTQMYMSDEKEMTSVVSSTVLYGLSSPYVYCRIMQRTGRPSHCFQARVLSQIKKENPPACPGLLVWAKLIA